MAERRTNRSPKRRFKDELYAAVDKTFVEQFRRQTGVTVEPIEKNVIE